MHGKKENQLVVIENGQLTVYNLDDKLVWNVGRPTKDNKPDISFYIPTVSRKHGSFQNMDGMWFYLDKKGKNGTVYNEKYVEGGLGGRSKPITLKHGDIMIFGGAREAVISSKTIWSLFLEYNFGSKWKVEDTKGLKRLEISDGKQTTILQQPQKGTVIEKEEGIVIYMGDISYMNGSVQIKCSGN